MIELSFIVITTYGPHLGDENDIRHKLHQHYLAALENVEYANFQVFYLAIYQHLKMEP